MSSSEDDFDHFVEYVNGQEINERRIRLPKRYVRDADNPLEILRDSEFKARYRFSKSVFAEVLVPIVRNLQKADNRGLPIPPQLQLLVSLRFYATGSFQVVCGDLRSISQPTVSRIISRVSSEICQNLRNHIFFPSTPNAENEVRKGFYDIARMPGIIGALDGTHILIRNPGGEHAEVFRNRKGRFSINVQCITGPDLTIFDIVARRPGSFHDSRIFDLSSVCVKFEQRQLMGILVGDAGYRCTPFLFTPVSIERNEADRRYNRAHRLTRKTVERTFGIWKRRFPCLERGLATSLETTQKIICATAILHNIARRVHDELEVGNDDGNDDPEEEMFENDNAADNVGFVVRRNYIQRHFAHE